MPVLSSGTTRMSTLFESRMAYTATRLPSGDRRIADEPTASLTVATVVGLSRPVAPWLRILDSSPERVTCVTRPSGDQLGQ